MCRIDQTIIVSISVASECIYLLHMVENSDVHANVLTEPLNLYQPKLFQITGGFF